MYTVKIDGCDDAILGQTSKGVLIYTYEGLVTVFMKKDKMTEQEANEWVQFNVLRALPYIREGRPVVVHLHHG